MKITRITVEYDVTSSTAAALAAILGSGAPVTTIEHTPLPLGGATADTASVTDAKPALENTAATTDAGTSRRRRTTAPAPAAAETAEAATPAADAGTSRRRRAAPPAAAPDPMPINDAEMSKAASNACEVLVNMGEDGPGIVKLILEEMGAASAGDIPQEKRQQFLDECAKEIRLAKEEKEMAP